MKTIPRAQMSDDGHVAWPVDLSIPVSNLLNVALAGTHVDSQYRPLDHLHDAWFAKVGTKDLAVALATKLDQIGRAQLPDELASEVTRYVQAITPPPYQTQDFSNYLLRALLGLEALPTYAETDPTPNACPGVELAELFESSMGYPRPALMVTGPDPATTVTGLFRLPHPLSKWSIDFAKLLIRLDPARFNMAIIAAVAQEVSKVPLGPGDRPFSDAQRLAIQLHAIAAVYVAYLTQGPLYIALCRERWLRLIHNRTSHFYPASRGRINKWLDAYEGLLLKPVHPIVSMAASLLRTKTTTPVGERDFVPIDMAQSLIDKLGDVDLLREFNDDNAAGRLESGSNLWLADAAALKRPWNIQDIVTAIDHSRCARLLDKVASAIGWTKATASVGPQELDRRGFILSDGDAFSRDPFGAIAGLAAILPLGYIKAYRLSGFAENFWDSEFDDEGVPSNWPVAAPVRGSAGPSLSPEGKPVKTLAGVTVSCLPCACQVTYANSLYLERDYIVAGMWMGEGGVVEALSDPSSIVDLEFKQVLVHFARRADTWPDRRAEWEHYYRFTTPVPTVTGTVLKDEDGKTLGWLWPTAWQPQGYAQLNAEQAKNALARSLPSGATPNNLGADLPRVLSAQFKTFFGSEGTSKLQLLSREGGKTFGLRVPLRKMVTIGLRWSDDFLQMQKFVPYASIEYDNSMTLSGTTNFDSVYSLIVTKKPEE